MILYGTIEGNGMKSQDGDGGPFLYCILVVVCLRLPQMTPSKKSSHTFLINPHVKTRVHWKSGAICHGLQKAHFSFLSVTA